MGKPHQRPHNIMSQSTYQSVVLAKRPKALIVPGETFTVKENKMVQEGDLKEGQVLLEVNYLSLDPAMRGWLNGMNAFCMFFMRSANCLFRCSIIVCLRFLSFSRLQGVHLNMRLSFPETHLVSI